jgi:prephenate dehydrogenase
MNSVAIVGLGLIGGSLALALKRHHPQLRVVACDFPEVLRSEGVRALGAESVPIADEARRRQAWSEVELVVLATPVGVIVQLLPEIMALASLVTDCGSTKRAIVACVEQSPRLGRFVPGHPMAGQPEGGLHNARADLYENRSWILCPEHSHPDAVTRIQNMIAAVGARAVEMSAAEHDRAVALTSHVPQLLASALASLAARTGAEPAAGPAFASATRVAGGSEAMWADIFRTNADAIASALQDLMRELENSARGLAADPADTRAALELLSQARKLRSRR